MKRLHNSVVRSALVVGMVATLGGVILAACGSGKSAATSSKPVTSAASGTKQGGTITVLESSNYFGNWTGMDPVVSTTQSSFESAVYGGLFGIGAHYHLIPDLATGYKVGGGGLTLTVYLRHGVTFTDGTPFDSQAVAYNWERDINPKLPNGPLNAVNWPMKTVTTPNQYTVVAHFSRVFAPVAEELNQSGFNLILSPMALKTMGEKKFAQYPVGAGPFEVAKDEDSAELILKRNPNYWEKGYPKLNEIKVEDIGDDESAYEALLSGQAQVYEGLGTLSIVHQIQNNHKLRLFSIPPNSPYVIQLNTLAPPFNNILAREALYYATDSASINKEIFGDSYSLTESPTGPSGLFYEPKVPGYRTYDPAKAAAIVKQLGGLTVSLQTISLTQAVQTDIALKSEWAKVGIKTTLNTANLESLIADFKSGKWQAFLQTAGSYDPALGLGIAFRFSSTSPFSGVHDPHLDALMQEATSTIDMAKRSVLYKEIFKYMSDQAYAPFMFNIPYYNIATKNVTGVQAPAGVGGVGSVIDWTDVGLT